MADNEAVRAELMLTGRRVAPQDTRRLRAGALDLELDGPDLRRVSLHGIEVLQQLYFAFRDVAWNTLPGVLSDVSIDEGPGAAFRVAFTSRHRFPALELDLSYRSEIVGTEDSELTYSVDVSAHSVVEYNRIGLNLLHGSRTYAGRPYRASFGDVETVGALPATVGPVVLVNGRFTGLFPPFERLQLAPIDGVVIDIYLEGDEFETEDQRNYGDNAFKTYSTPHQRPAPFRLEPGQRLRQRATIRVRDERPPSNGVDDRLPDERPISITLGAPNGHTVPAIGLGQVDDGQPLSPAELERARALRPDHLRVELDVAHGAPACFDRLRATAAQAQSLGCDVWVDLVAADGDDAVLSGLVESICLVKPAPTVIHLATPILEPPDAGRSGEMLSVVRAAIAETGASTLTGAGSYLFFADVNRAPFDGGAIERLNYPTCPTGHRVDDATVLENIDGLGAVVTTARDHLGHRPLAVGPITLATRHGPYPAGPSRPGALPPKVDVRQVSLFAAALTAGYLAELATAGADALTFFETAGWLGIAERDEGTPMPDLFPSRPGTIFPLWHVLADAADLRGAEILATELQPAPVFTPSVAALAVQDDAGLHIILASLSRPAQRVTIAGLEASSATLRSLDASTAEAAVSDPATFRSSGAACAIEDGHLSLELSGYAVTRIDAT